MLKSKTSDETFIGKREVRFAGDDQVIQDSDIQEFARFGDLFGDDNIGIGCGKGATGMVVSQDHGTGINKKSRLENAPGIHHGAGNPALGYAAIAQNLVRLVKKQDVERFKKFKGFFPDKEEDGIGILGTRDFFQVRIELDG